jgi:hypothetical protein
MRTQNRSSTVRKQVKRNFAHYAILWSTIKKKKQRRVSTPRWNLMEHIHNNLIKLGGSLLNVPKKLKKIVIKTQN